MRIHLAANRMLNGQSLQMCQDYWRPFVPNNQYNLTLEWHIRQVCQHYNVTFEELFSSLRLVKAYDMSIRCQHCGQMCEVFNPVDMLTTYPNYDWVCEDCGKFIEQNSMNLQQFLDIYEPQFNCPF